MTQKIIIATSFFFCFTFSNAQTKDKAPKNALQNKEYQLYNTQLKDNKSNIHIDSLHLKTSLLKKQKNESKLYFGLRNSNSEMPYSFNIKQLIIPISLTTIGIIGIKSDWMEYQRKEIRDELQENIDNRFSIDDFSQYASILSVYALNLTNLKGKHNFKDRTIILATSSILMGLTTNVLKYTTKVERPDGSTRNSFPSGHTAMAFMGAEFLYQEYKEVSPWIGVAGYAVATGTGFFRMYNNRHWFTDVLAGAGIGMLSTKAAYWLYPYINNHLFNKNNKEKTILVSPFISNEGKGLSCAIIL